jgi:hypothetical protein
MLPPSRRGDGAPRSIAGMAGTTSGRGPRRPADPQSTCEGDALLVQGYHVPSDRRVPSGRKEKVHAAESAPLRHAAPVKNPDIRRSKWRRPWHYGGPFPVPKVLDAGMADFLPLTVVITPAIEHPRLHLWRRRGSLGGAAHHRAGRSLFFARCYKCLSENFTYPQCSSCEMLSSRHQATVKYAICRSGTQFACCFVQQVEWAARRPRRGTA